MTNPTKMFEEFRMPDGTAKGRKAWRAQRGDVYVAFYAVGRKGRYYITWGAVGRDGGEQVESFYGAEKRAAAILDELATLGLVR